MKNNKTEQLRKCPHCGKTEHQIKAGFNASGTQRYKCKECGKQYTLEPKKHEYSEQTRELALKIYYSGVSARGVARILKMNKSNIANWIKKTKKMIQQQQQQFDCVELDELYWFIERKNTEKACKNIYVITMVSRQPRQILGFDVAFDKTSERIQKIINDAAEAEKYCTDGYYGYLDVIYTGKHIYNIHNKKDSFTVEGVNADLRHYILTLARRSRCFARKLENLRAAISVFVHAYNKFGLAKYHYRLTHKKRKCLFLLLISFNCSFEHSPRIVKRILMLAKKIYKRWFKNKAIKV